MKRIEFMPGQSLDDAFKTMQELGEPCFGEFNGNEIKSTDTLDEAYIKVLGVTKSEQADREDQREKEYEDKESKYKAKIPQLTEEYRARARGVIPEDKLELWDRVVPIRLGDLYHGMELDCWLDLISELNNSDKEKTERFRICEKMFSEQGHSGISAGLVFWGLKQLHPLGAELVKYISEK